MQEETSLKELTQLWGTSGHEKQVEKYIATRIHPYCDELYTDSLGNLIAFKRGNGKDKKKIMCAAHMDEIGFSVQAVTEDGFVNVRNIGGVTTKLIQNTRIEFENGVQGVITTNETEDKQTGGMDSYYIDIGALSKEEALKAVSIGSTAVFQGEYSELLNNCVLAKALDNRVGCYVLMEVMRKIENAYHDIYFVFTTQEEFGLVGATVAAERIKPELGIAVDITGCYDTPGSIKGNMKLGMGAAIKSIDASVICDQDVIEMLIQCAEDENIMYQMDVLPAGGTDVGAIKKAHYGCKGAGISLATRNGHGPCSICSMHDVQASIDLLICFLKKETVLDSTQIYKK